MNDWDHPQWWWRVKPTGRPPAFDADAAREAAGEDDPNSPRSMFYSGPEDQ